jgi:hypothetical protein
MVNRFSHRGSPRGVEVAVQDEAEQDAGFELIFRL